MILLTNAQIEQLLTTKPFSTLLDASNLPIRVRLSLSELDVKIGDVARAYTKLKQKIIEELCDKEEDGKPRIVNGQYVFTNNAQDVAERLNGLYSQERSVDVNKVRITDSSLENLPLSSRDLTILKSVIEIVEETVAEKKA